MLDYLKTEADVRRYLDLAFETEDAAYIAAALGTAAKARRLMSKVAQKAGVARESLYQSLSEKGRPQFGTILSVVHSLGYQLSLVPQKKQRVA